MQSPLLTTQLQRLEQIEKTLYSLTVVTVIYVVKLVWKFRMVSCRPTIEILVESLGYKTDFFFRIFRI
jgi:cell division protein FtsL